MSLDLSDMLNEWPYEPGHINARLIRGDDGEPRVQIRVDLGVLQMHVSGRPDGLRPEGFPSLLEYYEHKFDVASDPTGSRSGEDEDDEEESDELLGREDASSGPGGSAGASGGSGGAGGVGGSGLGGGVPSGGFALTPDDCRQLREEAVQYYHRYVALLALEDFDGVVRDTSRNLRLIDFIAKHAQGDQDRSVLEQFRPYIVMMRSRALASAAVRDDEAKAAILAIDQGLDMLKQHFEESGSPQDFEESGEVEMLRGMRAALLPRLPISQKSELRRRLARAVEQENYELAAILRDELKLLRDPDEGDLSGGSIGPGPRKPQA